MSASLSSSFGRRPLFSPLGDTLLFIGNWSEMTTALHNTSRSRLNAKEEKRTMISIFAAMITLCTVFVLPLFTHGQDVDFALCMDEIQNAEICIVMTYRVHQFHSQRSKLIQMDLTTTWLLLLWPSQELGHPQDHVLTIRSNWIAAFQQHFVASTKRPLDRWRIKNWKPDKKGVDALRDAGYCRIIYLWNILNYPKLCSRNILVRVRKCPTIPFMRPSNSYNCKGKKSGKYPDDESRKTSDMNSRAPLQQSGWQGTTSGRWSAASWKWSSYKGFYWRRIFFLHFFVAICPHVFSSPFLGSPGLYPALFWF